MIPPTVGRVVWYRPSVGDAKYMMVRDGQPLAAIVAYVWNDHRVNLTVFDHDGVPYCAKDVFLRQDDDVVPPGHEYAEWMPYQVGQAKKHEAESLAAQPAP